MKTIKNILIAVALGLCVLFTVGLAQQSRPQFEYKIEYKMDEKKANRLGAEGWELAGVGSFSSGSIIMQEYVFKRVK